MVHAQRREQGKHWLPQSTVKIEDNARPGMAKLLQTSQSLQDVVKMNSQIGKNDVVKRSHETGTLFRRLFVEFQFRMPRFSCGNHLRTDIDPSSTGCSKRGKQISRTDTGL